MTRSCFAKVGGSGSSAAIPSRGELILLRDVVDPVEIPDDSELQDWLDAHPDRYVLPARASFEHLFSSRRHPDAKERALALQRQQAGQEARITEGDPFPHGHQGVQMTLPAVQQQFGEPFAQVVARASVGKWTLAPSDFGWHVVRVTERIPGGPGSLEDVREAVEQDWMAEQERTVEAEALQRLREAADL